MSLYFFFLSFVKMKGGTLQYYAPETSKQLGRGLGGILRNTFKDIFPFAGGAADKMKQAGVNYGKRKLLNYAYGEMVERTTIGWWNERCKEEATNS